MVTGEWSFGWLSCGWVGLRVNERGLRRYLYLLPRGLVLLLSSRKIVLRPEKTESEHIRKDNV